MMDKKTLKRIRRMKAQDAARFQQKVQRGLKRLVAQEVRGSHATKKGKTVKETKDVKEAGSS